MIFQFELNKHRTKNKKTHCKKMKNQNRQKKKKNTWKSRERWFQIKN